ncbi:molybdopterin molybdotransferase MoeA [Zhihengliuella flava]|uniref:Molybdopterin molybdenumtransferase n=1 Tax=Zhihengliuella flava TaxID=1285193 RepID=A0A931DBP3_9MICC|nr:gephyrin-like molybdotransferase Glp [Zhihengliuella flava]MBG6083790.1 molybdopterin molybdotransferase [Zhihengliuella flava]
MTEVSRFRRSVTEHRAAVAELMGRVAARSETLPLRAALGRVLAEDVAAPIDLPPFDNSQMDGYAVRAADLASSEAGARVGLAVARPIAAGTDPAPLAPGTAAPIMTGAALPDGAELVVPIEAAVPETFPAFVVDVGVEYDAGSRVSLPGIGSVGASGAGQYVRRAGSDVGVGARVMAAGERVSARHVGLAAALGLTELPVVAPLRALVIATGEEIVDPGTAPEQGLAPGQIYESNSAMLVAALAEAGAEAVGLRVTSDAPEVFWAQLGEAARRHTPDLILTSGGISAGAYEVVKLALAEAGVEFGAVAMQPGGPQGAGVIELDGHGVPVVAFPGNPVSSYVSFEMFVRPVLAERFGAAPRRRQRARLKAETDSPPGKLQLRRARLTDVAADPAELPSVELLGGPGSHLMYPLAAANALVLVEESTTHVGSGAMVDTLVIGE